MNYFPSFRPSCFIRPRPANYENQQIGGDKSDKLHFESPWKLKSEKSLDIQRFY